MKVDNSLYNTRFGELVKKGLNVTEDLSKSNSVKGIGIKQLRTYEFSGNCLSRLAGRTLLRIPVIGLIASSLLEASALVKSIQKEGTFFDKTKSFINQFCKSAGYVGITNATIALAGAALLPYGYIAALVGMGVGSSLSLVMSKSLNKQIDKII